MAVRQIYGMLMELTGQGQQLCLHALTPGRFSIHAMKPMMLHVHWLPLVAIGCFCLLWPAFLTPNLLMLCCSKGSSVGCACVLRLLTLGGLCLTKRWHVSLWSIVSRTASASCCYNKAAIALKT